MAAIVTTLRLKVSMDDLPLIAKVVHAAIAFHECRAESDSCICEADELSEAVVALKNASA